MITIACSREDVGEPDQRDYSDLERYATQTSVIIRTTE